MDNKCITSEAECVEEGVSREMNREVDEIAKKQIGGDIKIVQEIVEGNFPRFWEATDACLSVCATLLLDDLTNPVGINLLGPPSCSKTTVLSFFYKSPYCYKSDHFTPASFVSHSVNVKKEDLAKIDMLPKIKNKIMVIPELAPVFSKRKEYLEENIGVLIRVFDGQGFQSDTGAQGRRGYSGEHLFAWLGATIPLPHRVWQTMGKLGSRWLFMLMPKELAFEEQQDLEVDDLINNVTYKDKVNQCREVIGNYLNVLFEKYKWHIDKESGKVKVGHKIEWDRKVDKEHIRSIVSIAQLVARARSTVSIWIEKGDSDEAYSYAQPIKEVPSRLKSILYNLARGHAIIHNRQNLNEDDVILVSKIALSSMQDDRREVLKLLLKRRIVSTKEICDSLSIDNRTARSIMKTLEVLGVVSISEDGTGSQYHIELSGDFKSLLNDTNSLSGLISEIIEDEQRNSI